MLFMLTRLLLVLVVCVPLFAQMPRAAGDYVRYLLPFHASTSSANGTWFVDWWIRNEGEVAADAFPLAFRCGLPPPPGPEGPRVFMLGRPALPAKTTVSCLVGDVLPSTPVPPTVPVVSASSGAFVYVESAHARNVTFGGNVRWFGIGRNGAAASLRAVPAGSFLSGARSIMPVPAMPERRYAIRVYALPESLAAGARAELRVYEMSPADVVRPEEQLRHTAAIELRVPESRVLPCLNACDIPPLGYVPAVAEVFGLPIADNRGRISTLRFEIVPESPSLRWWAVVSATDNVNHDIAVWEPAALRTEADNR
jgi:hypothetical protein